MTNAEKKRLRAIIAKLTALQARIPQNIVHAPTPSTIVRGRTDSTASQELDNCIRQLERLTGKS